MATEKALLGMRFAAIAAIAVCTSGAYDLADLTDPTQYVQLETSDSTTFSSITNGEHWSTHEPPTAGLKYFVPKDKSISSPLVAGSHATFEGDELLIAGHFSMLGYENAYLEVPHFTMFHGSTFDFAGNVRSGRRYFGEMTVDPQRLGTNTANNCIDVTLPTKGAHDTITRIQDLDYDLVGPSGATIVWGRGLRTGQERVGLAWFGDNTRYFGTLWATGASRTVLGIGTSDMPGTVKITSQAHFARFTNRVSGVGLAGVPNVISRLVMYDDTTIECASGAPLTVTNELSLGSTINLAFGGSLMPSLAATPAQTNDVITLAAGATGTLDINTFNMSYEKFGPFPAITSFSVVTNADNSKTLRVTTREIVQFDSTKSVTNAAIEATEPGKDYLYSPTGSSSSYNSYYGDAFKGETLYLKNVGNFVGTSSEREGLYAPNLYLAGSSTAHLYSVDTFKVRGYGAYYVRGGMTLDPGYTGTWRIRGGKLLFVESTVSGPADLKLNAIHPTASAHNPGYIEFTALNTNFTGRVVLYNNPATKNIPTGGAPSESITIVVFVTDGRNLGGPLADFTYDALTLSGWGKVSTITNSVVFDQANRGVLVKGKGQVEATDGDTITFMNPLTMAGELLKKGPGTLALGGAMRFIDGEESTEPLAGTNVVTVKAGWIKPLATNALDGAALAFGTGTGLRIDVSPTADGLAESGFVNVKANGSVGLADGATGKILLAFDGMPPSEGVSLGVATLSARSDAETLCSLLQIVRPKGCKGRLKVVENADGTATVKVALSPAGTAFIIR